MTALWSGMSPSRVRYIATQDSSMHAHGHLESFLTAASYSMLNSQSPRLCGHLETLEFFPHHLPATGQLSLFSEYFGGKPQQKRVLKKRGFWPLTGRRAWDSGVPWNDTAAQLFPHARPYTRTTSQVSLPVHSLSPHCRKSFLHTYNSK